MRILLTGGAGFIGSNIVEQLLQDKRVTLVRVLDNLATGSLKNIDGFSGHQGFEFMEGDIRQFQTCLKACENIDVINHQAALGSVPRSVDDPLTTNEVNITGTLNIFTAAKDKNIKRVVYAASFSTLCIGRTTPSPLAPGSRLSLSRIRHGFYPTSIAQTPTSQAPCFAELSPRRGDCRVLHHSQQ